MPGRSARSAATWAGPFPVADAYRLGLRLVLPDATEAMRRYPRFAAGLPFPFGSLYVPVAGADRAYGVLTVLRAPAPDSAELLEGVDRVTRPAQELGAALDGLERGGAVPVVRDGEPLSIRPPAPRRRRQRAGSFAWDPATGALTFDEPLCALLGTAPERAGRPGPIEALTAVLAPDDGHRLAAALRGTASGRRKWAATGTTPSPRGTAWPWSSATCRGHGVRAAATRGRPRSAVRAFALGDRAPDEVMSGVSHLPADLDPGLSASCCYVRLDPATGGARTARAGHPPPLPRHPDGRTEALDLPGGVVLGVDPGAPYPLTEFRMEPGAVLALYTDGLVERPGTDIDDGITALRLAPARAGAPAARPCGRALAGVGDRLVVTVRHASDRPDGIALLLATRRARPRSPPVRAHADPRAVPPGAPRLLWPGSVDMGSWSD